MMKKGAAIWSVLFVVVLLAVEVQETAAATCNPTELLPCLSAITGGGTPSADCCSKLKEQQPCFCQYIANPMYKAYIDSPNARKVVADCGVTIPTC